MVSSLSESFQDAFKARSKLLDIGSGSCRDLALLVSFGHDQVQIVGRDVVAGTGLGCTGCNFSLQAVQDNFCHWLELFSVEAKNSYCRNQMLVVCGLKVLNQANAGL